MRYWQTCFLLLLLYTCQNQETISRTAYECLPAQPLFILEANDYQSIESSLSELLWFANLTTEIEAPLKSVLNHYQVNDGLAVGFYNIEDRLNFALAFKEKQDSTKTQKHITLNNAEGFSIDNQPFFYQIKHGFTLISTHPDLLNPSSLSSETYAAIQEKTEDFYKGVQIHKFPNTGPKTNPLKF